MSAQLGIGTRVFVKWAPQHWCESDDVNLTGFGRIVCGPYPPIPRQLRMKPSWDVQMDGGRTINVDEDLLEPIDGGDPVTTERREEVEA